MEEFWRMKAPFSPHSKTRSLASFLVRTNRQKGYLVVLGLPGLLPPVTLKPTCSSALYSVQWPPFESLLVQHCPHCPTACGLPHRPRKTFATLILWSLKITQFVRSIGMHLREKTYTLTNNDEHIKWQRRVHPQICREKGTLSADRHQTIRGHVFVRV